MEVRYELVSQNASFRLASGMFLTDESIIHAYGALSPLINFFIEMLFSSLKEKMLLMVIPMTEYFQLDKCNDVFGSHSQCFGGFGL